MYHLLLDLTPKKTAEIFCVFVCAILFTASGTAYGSLRSPFDRAMGEAFIRFVPAGNDCGGRIFGGVVPHHDIAVGMMLRFYGRFPRDEVKRVFLFSPDHFRRARRWAAVCPDDWELSPGTMAADSEAIESLGKMDIVELRSDMFGAEHGVTVHIPLLARFFPRASVIPIVLRPDIPDIALLSLKRALSRVMRDGDIVILSADLSHYKTPEEMAAEDGRTVKVLTNLEAGAANFIDIDAKRASSLVIRLFRDMGANRGELLERSDTSEILGRRIESGTSYATIIYK